MILHNFPTFKQFQEERKKSPDHICHKSFNSDDVFELILEGIIIPHFTLDDSKLTLDVNKLNSMQYFKDLKVHFDDSEDSTYHPEFGINIGMKFITNLLDLKSSIKHEMIHAIQHEKSSGKYLNYAKSLEKNFEREAKSGKLKSKEEFYKEYQNVSYKINFDNPYEKMAYAFQLVYVYVKVLSKDDLIELVKRQFPEWKSDKQFLKYFYMYYERYK